MPVTQVFEIDYQYTVIMLNETGKNYYRISQFSDVFVSPTIYKNCQIKSSGKLFSFSKFQII